MADQRPAVRGLTHGIHTALARPPAIPPTACDDTISPYAWAPPLSSVRTNGANSVLITPSPTCVTRPNTKTSRIARPAVHSRRPSLHSAASRATAPVVLLARAAGSRPAR